MKLKHKYLKNVAVYCKGKFYNFVDGEIEVSEAEGIELLKNINICEVEEVSEVNTEDKNDEDTKSSDIDVNKEKAETGKNSGRKGNK